MERAFIVHVDDHLVVVDKPAGLPSVPGRPQALRDCAATRVQALFPDARVVHRLDMDTSGLLLFARGLQVQRALSRAFEQRRIDKAYEAVVHGHPVRPEGEVDLPLIADWPNRPRQKVDVERGKAALTHWRVLSREGTPAAPGLAPSEGTGFAGTAQPCSRVALQPVTGRSHQLRVHMSAMGHPILGDALYAPEEARQLAPRLLLHATRLALDHPGTGQRLDLRSQAPF